VDSARLGRKEGREELRRRFIVQYRSIGVRRQLHDKAGARRRGWSLKGALSELWMVLSVEQVNRMRVMRDEGQPSSSERMWWEVERRTMNSSSSSSRRVNVL
jgi:hypothetical protein